MNLKNLVITEPSRFLSEQAYVNYLQVLSRVFAVWSSSIPPIRIREVARNEAASPSNAPTIWNVTSSQFNIITPSGYRCSRFLKGFNHAAAGQWERYGIESLVRGTIPDVTIDIGANIGEFSQAAIQKGVTRILAIEPDPIAFGCLESNLGGKGVSISNFALGEKKGTAILYSASGTADSSLIEPDVKNDKIETQVFRLEDIALGETFSGNVLVKMDAEGAEPEVLRGFGKFASEIEWITIDVGPERHGQSTSVEVEGLLREAGFETEHFSEYILHGRKIPKTASKDLCETSIAPAPPSRLPEHDRGFLPWGKCAQSARRGR
jgi:FkbM family methyltransferase